MAESRRAAIASPVLATSRMSVATALDSAAAPRSKKERVTSFSRTGNW
jgi:hypothetical protein